MDQQRLNIFTRKISDQEREHSARIDRLKAEIQEQYRIIDEKSARFFQRKEQQQQFGIGFGEAEATEKLLASILKPNRAALQKCKQELIELTGSAGQVQKAGASQSDLFN